MHKLTTKSGELFYNKNTFLSHPPIFHDDKVVFLSELFQLDTNFSCEVADDINVGLEDADMWTMGLSQLKKYHNYSATLIQAPLGD